MLYTIDMNKKKASPAEKRDALLAEMASLRDLLNGSLVQRYSTCSRKSCSCHTGKRHGPRLYLAVTGDDGQHQTYIPATCATRATEGVAQGKRLRAIVREVTALNLQLFRGKPAEAGRG
ncbi:MAG: DUF6788 family protein [bacterium]